jgi:hypothetical protein
MIKLIDLIKEEDNKIIIPRNIEGRKKKRLEMIYQEIQDYIKAGSKTPLHLSRTPITSLPDNLKKVGGSLKLNYSKIESLPDNLQVNGDLELIDTLIKSLPSNLQVKDNLYLIGTPIESLPNNLQVEGDLYLGDTQIKTLPSNLQVGGNLYLKFTPIAEKYSKDEIRQMIEDKGGFVTKEIYI